MNLPLGHSNIFLDSKWVEDQEDTGSAVLLLSNSRTSFPRGPIYPGMVSVRRFHMIVFDEKHGALLRLKLHLPSDYFILI